MGTDVGDNAEADLLFGIFAVQLGFVSAQSVMSCGAAWAVDKSKSISERLLELGANDEEKQALLTTMNEQAIKAHGGSPQETLKSIGGDAMVFKSFGGSMAVVQARPVPGSDTQADTAAPGMGIGRGGQEDTDLVTLEHGGRYTYGANNIPDSDAADEIGRGGIGRILKAQDAHLGREIAMKELLGDESGSVPKASDPIGSHNSAMVAVFCAKPGSPPGCSTHVSCRCTKWGFAETDVCITPCNWCAAVHWPTPSRNVTRSKIGLPASLTLSICAKPLHMPTAEGWFTGT